MTERDRLGSIAFGTLVGTLALIALFVTQNEAGTAVALLLAGVLILAGIQGTPLIEFGSKDNGFRLDQQRETIAEKATERATKDPREAEAMIEGYQVADPDACTDPVVAGALAAINASRHYENRVMKALADVAKAQGGQVLKGRHADMLVRSDGLRIVVEAMHLPPHQTLNADYFAQINLHLSTGAANAALVVTNTPNFSADVQLANSLSEIIDVVYWVDAEGTEPLLEAITKLKIRMIESPQSA